MTLFSCTIPGQPCAKGRPRVVMIKGQARAYTPAKTARWESNAACLMRNNYGQAPINHPVEVVVRSIYKRPKRLHRRKDPAGLMWKPTKPDCDNELKATLDALVLAGVITDDNLVVRATVESCFAEKDGGPRVTVTVSKVVGEPWT